MGDAQNFWVVHDILSFTYVTGDDYYSFVQCEWGLHFISPYAKHEALGRWRTLNKFVSFLGQIMSFAITGFSDIHEELK